MVFAKIRFLIVFFVLSFSALAELPTVVIVHGFMGKPEYHEELKSPLTRILKNFGFPVYIAETPRVATIEEHAEILKEGIEKNIPKGKELILIGHSQGGLVSRLYTYNESRLKKGRKVLNVTTIGTPHRGAVRPELIRGEEFMRGLLEWARPFMWDRYYEFNKVAMEMYGNSMERFNQEVTNVKGVDYASVTTLDKKFHLLFPFLNITDSVRDRIFGEGDGLVPASSSKWGREILLNGDYGRANHLNQIYNFFGDGIKAESVGFAVSNYLLDFLDGKLRSHSGPYNFNTKVSRGLCLSIISKLIPRPSF